ncbi:hypothetical protein LRM36_15210 [Stenotrophomonas maltophilia]|nr:hypothetical protein [Stenotrophomonas maltophilia]
MAWIYRAAVGSALKRAEERKGTGAQHRLADGGAFLWLLSLREQRK